MISVSVSDTIYITSKRNNFSLGILEFKIAIKIVYTKLFKQPFRCLVLNLLNKSEKHFSISIPIPRNLTIALKL